LGPQGCHLGWPRLTVKLFQGFYIGFEKSYLERLKGFAAF
jgi:hypothetical protein